jgi:hypothetical protein
LRVLEALLKLGGVLKSFEVLEAIWSLEVHKCLIGVLWRYLEALDVHMCTFQHFCIFEGFGGVFGALEEF